MGKYKPCRKRLMFFTTFQKVPRYLMYDGPFPFGHLLSLPSSTFQ